MAEEMVRKILTLDVFKTYIAYYTGALKKALCNEKNGVVTNLIKDKIKDIQFEEVSDEEFNTYYEMKQQEIISE